MTPAIHEWAKCHNISHTALSELAQIMGVESTEHVSGVTGPESKIQNDARLAASKMGWRLWRNNKGVLKDDRGVPVRFGLCNDNKELGERVRSSDLIGIRPVIITPDMVGTTLGQFVAREIKKEGWKYTGTAREKGQLTFGEIVTSLGGDFKFWNGSGEL